MEGVRKECRGWENGRSTEGEGAWESGRGQEGGREMRG